jgi:hypothetical protein
MNTRFTQRIRLTIGFAALLFIGFASSNLYTQSKSQQIAKNSTEQNLLQTQQSNSALAANFQNSLIAQQTSDKAADKQSTPASADYQVIDEMLKYKFSIQGSKIFAPGKLPSTKVNLNQADLLTVLVNTRKYYQDYSKEDPNVLRTGLLGTQGVTVEDILKTLDFMIVVLQEDIAKNQATRLQDSDFINQNFRVIKWSAYNPKISKQKQLRMTKYAVFTHSGSRKKTSKYNIPIYSLKDNLAVDKFYTKYTKQDVLSGIYEPGGKEFGKVEPLAYMTRNGLEDALMQGTILINFSDGSQAFFNVDRNNEMPYVKGLAPRAQKRYWYFRKVDAIKGYGYKIDAKISIKPGVTFAGDVLNIGLGRVVVLEYNKGRGKQLKLGVIADTGGAFLPNLYQLDFLSGIFKNQREFEQYIRQLPEYVTAYILVKK